MSTAVQTAADVMTASPRTCSPFSTVLEAVMIFRDADCGAVPVLDEGKPVGVLTDRDVALALTEFGDTLTARPVTDLMTVGVLPYALTTVICQVGVPNGVPSLDGASLSLNVANAIIEPSGDQAGCSSENPCSGVNCSSFLLSISYKKMRSRGSLR